MINLEGKTALLTASGQGIGKATAEAFVKAGAYVIATDINEESLDNLKKTVHETHKLDVTNQDAIRDLMKLIKEPNPKNKYVNIYINTFNENFLFGAVRET